MDNLPPADTYCTICNKHCIQECLKCQKCKRYIHADCSQLPAYAIVNFFNTRCQYTCEECVRKQLGEDCDRLFAQVYTLIEKERATRKQQLEQQGAEKDFDNINEHGDENESVAPDESSLLPNHPGKQDNNQTTTPNTNESSGQRKAKVCYFYKNNKCKYGLSGRDCSYAHPKLCNRYKINGCDPVRGCKKGNNCTFLHPSLCYGSERKRECFNMDCKRLHLKGTRRYTFDQTTTEQQTRQQAASTKQLPTRPTIPLPDHQPHNAWSNGPPHQIEKQQTSTTESFLLQQMQQMQQVQQQILHMLKTIPWQGAPMHPLQGYHQQSVAALPTTFIK